ncbi:MAG: HAMP domain-containing histidine kinase [Nitrospiraceae bacterium]|nr:HAMP domain-containing histidine kinase [Nitrospiraceae bacterium]
MIRMFQSIKARLFIFIFVSISALLIGSGFFVYNEVKNMLIASVDEGLHSDIQVFTGLLRENRGRVEFEFSEVVSGDYAIPRLGHYYKIMSSGKVIAASPSLVDPDFQFHIKKDSSSFQDENAAAFTSDGPDGEPVRVIRQEIRIFDSAVTLIAARSVAESQAMMHKFRIFLIIVILGSIGLIAFAGLAIVRQGLKPLYDFASEVKRITHQTLGKRMNDEAQCSELKALSQSFNDMLDRLQKSFEAEKRIVSDASHQLKTPVAVIRSQCDVMLQKSRSAAEYVDALQSIKTVSGRMGEIIRDMLSLAQLDSGVLGPSRFTRVDLEKCIRDAAGLARLLAQDKGISLSVVVDRLPEINGSSERLIEAFLNIIENAIRYNREHGSVVVSASYSDGNAVIKVMDTGMGISVSEREKIFGRFYRADSAGRLEGTGLGLSIAKAVIDAHGGDIKVQSEEGKGSEFVISLPVSAD